MIDLEDFLFKLWFVFAGIVVLVLLVISIYGLLSEISKDTNDNKNDYQNCTCEKVEVR